jgi:hypothetical protein
LGRLVALAGIGPQNHNKPAPSPMDDERDQADMQALDARLSRVGNIRDVQAGKYSRR